MIRFDFLIGTFELSSVLEALLQSPELQRLKDIRLLNINSPTFGVLSDVRRLSHSICVAALSHKLLAKLGKAFSPRDIMHWQAALLLHDVGTPPFGHLLEYRLLERWGWRHDSVLTDIVYGRYRPDSIHDQIYYGNQLRLHHILSDLDLDPEILAKCILGQLPLGKLVSGSIDLDNIDGVFRMASLLGMRFDRSYISKLVNSLDIVEDSIVIDEEGIEAVELWLRLRHDVYKIFLFDPPTLSLQAMLTDAFDKAMDAGELSTADWRLTDDGILRKLMAFEETKLTIKRLAIDDYYQPVAILWFDDPDAYGSKLLKARARLEFQDIISRETGISIISYPFMEKGSLSKHLSIRVRKEDGLEADPSLLSKRSCSFVVGLFTPLRTTISDTQKARIKAVAVSYLHELGIHSRRPIPQLLRNKEQYYEQTTFAF